MANLSEYIFINANSATLSANVSTGNLITSNIINTIAGNINYTGNMLPTSNIYELGSPIVPWSNAFFGSNSITILDTATGNAANSVTIENNGGNISMGTAAFVIGALGNLTPVFTIEALTGQILSNAVTAIINDTNASNTTSGSLRTLGGLGVVRDAYIGGNLTANAFSTGNLTITDSTITSNLVNGDIDITTNGDGQVHINSNAFQVQTTTNPNPVFTVNSTGDVQILTPTFPGNVGAVNIVGSATGNFVVNQNSGVMLHLTGQDGSPSRIYNDSNDAYSAYIGRRTNGNVDAPAQVLANEIFTRFGGTPYAVGGFPNISTTRVDFVTTENQTATNQGSKIVFSVTPSGANAIANIVSITGNGITFLTDGSTQNTAGIPLTQRANANGVATLGADGIVPLSQLPITGATVYKGTYNATTNTPTLVNGTGTAGWEYAVVVAGTQDFGAGPVVMNVGDFVIYDGTIWQDIPIGGQGVTSFNTRVGAVTLSSTDVGTALGYTAYNGATNPNGYVNTAGAAAAAPVQSFNTRVGNVTLQSSDVTTALTSGALVNDKLANSNVIIGNTTVTLGSTVTTFTGITSITATTLKGEGGNISNIQGANVSGAVAFATTANAVAGANVSGAVAFATTANSVAGSNVSGAVAFATTANSVAGSNVSGAVAFATTANAVAGANVSGAVAFATTANAVAGANVSGAVGLATFATTANAVAGANVSGAVAFATTANAVAGGNVSGAVAFATTANAVAGANVSGTVANANYAAYAGNVTIAGQSNITSLGTLTGFASNGVVNFTNASNVTLGAIGNVHVTGGAANNVIITNGSGNLSFTSLSNINGVGGNQLVFVLNAQQSIGSAKNTLLSLFGLTNGVALATNTRYQYEILFNHQCSKAGVLSYALALGSGTVVAQHNYNVICNQTTSLAAYGAGVTMMSQNATGAAITTAQTVSDVDKFTHTIIWGTIDVTTGGNVNFMVSQDQNTPITWTINAGSYIKLLPLGAIGANTTAGTWS